MLLEIKAPLSAEYMPTEPGHLVNKRYADSLAPGGSASHSTSEEWTGKYWLDGRKIYRRTFILGALPNKATKTVNTNIAGLQDAVGLEAWSGEPGGGVRMPLLPYVDTASGLFAGNVSISVWLEGSTFHIRTGSNRSSFTATFATLYYTCDDR